MEILATILLILWALWILSLLGRGAGFLMAWLERANAEATEDAKKPPSSERKRGADSEYRGGVGL